MTRRLSIAHLAVAGLIAPVWFLTLVVVQGLMHPDYSHIAMPISALAAWPAGWLQNLNFFVSGVLMAAFAIALHHGIQPTRFGVVGVALLLANAVGLWIVAGFPWIRVNGVLIEPPGHAAGAILTFLSAGLGHVILSRRMGADPQWRDLSAYVLWTGIVILLLFVVLGGFAIEAGTPLHRWAGLLQRVLVVIWFTCIVVMARRAMRLARSGWATS